MTVSKRVGHRTSGTVYECSEIAGSQQSRNYASINFAAEHFLVILIFHLSCSEKLELIKRSCDAIKIVLFLAVFFLIISVVSPWEGGRGAYRLYVLQTRG
jgi:hypothetical protein